MWSQLTGNSPSNKPPLSEAYVETLLVPKRDSRLQEYTQNNIEEAGQHQLGRWAYEVDEHNLTLAERLQKSQWQAERLERN